jgi:leader peptidase (prepilin peptidase)/N-methyltransferase
MFVSLSSLFLIGLLVGSFISAVSYRIPRNLGFVKGRSFCDSCKKDLFWYDNIPLFSYLFYRGKSRCCSKKISIRYPLIELFTAFGFVILYLSSLSPIYYPAGASFAYILYTVSFIVLVIDLEHQIIPDELSWLVLFLALFTVHSSLFAALFSGFLYSLSLLSLYLLTSGKGMGLGDVKLAIGLGAWLGLVNGLTWLMASFIIGGIVASILLLFKKANMKTKIAFGPFLIVGFWIVHFLR